MDLPLADEVREARRLAEEARDAAIFDKRIGSALGQIDVLMQTLDSLGAEVALPGDDVIDDLCERWEALVDLPAAGPRPTQSLGERLHLRRQQLQSAHQYLGPLAREAGRRAEEMSHLQHEQRHLLEDPKYRHDMVELAAVAAERSEVQFQLTPLVHRINSLGPAAIVVATFIERIDWVVNDDIGWPAGAEWRAAIVTRDVVAAIGMVLDEYNLEMRRPVPIAVPESPNGADSEQLKAAVANARAACARLHQELLDEKVRLTDQTLKLQQRFDELNQQIVDRMG